MRCSARSTTCVRARTRGPRPTAPRAATDSELVAPGHHVQDDREDAPAKAHQGAADADPDRVSGRGTEQAADEVGTLSARLCLALLLVEAWGGRPPPPPPLPPGPRHPPPR